MKPTLLIWLSIHTLIICTPPAESAANIQITNLNKNPGLLTLDIGKTFVKIGKHQVYHIIDLERCEPLGSSIKQITGNLNNNDLIKISENIRKLELNNEILITENNQQVKINHQLEDKINRIIDQLERDHNQIRSSLI